MKKPLQLSKVKSLKAIISACIMVSTALTANAQNYFELTFGNPGTQYERFNSGTYFGGDLVGAGYATSPSGSYIVRVNASTGQYVWQSRLGDATEVNSIQNTTDGNMIMGGTKLNGSNSSKMALIKINGNGGWLWTKTFGGTFQYQAEKAIQTSDGGYAIFGTKQLDLQNQFSSGRLYLLKTNSSGDSLWAKTYGVLAGWQRGHDVIELSGGGYAVCGESYNSVSTVGGSIVIRTDANGDTLWTRTVGAGYDGARKLIQSGNYIYVLNQLSMNSQGQILVFDMNGNYTVLSNLSNNVAVGGFVRNLGGSFSVALTDYNSDNVKIYNISTAGVAQLIHTFSGDYQLDANALIPTWINQLAVFGRDYDYQVGQEDGWMASLDTLGNVQQIGNNCSVEIGVSDTVVCQGAYIPNPMPTGTAPFTYYWTPPIGMSNPNIANPVIEEVFNQQYTLIVTDANGCTAVDNVTVTSYTASNDSVYLCNNGTALLDFGPGATTYSWQTWVDTNGVSHSLNITSQTLTVDEPGTYIGFEYITGGCGVITSVFNVGLCEDVCDNAWNLFTYQHNPFCGGDSILFVGTGGGIITNWMWNAFGNTFGNASTAWLVVTNTQPFPVYLNTIDNNGCNAGSVMTITPQLNSLDIDLGQDTVICNGDYTINPIITGGSAPYNYQWQPANEIANPNQLIQTFSNVYNETYWLWVTDAQGCTTLDTINITAVNTLDYMDTVYACNSQSYLELAPGANSYQWSNGATTQGIIFSGTGQISGYGVYSNCVLYHFITILPCNNNCTNTFTYQHNPFCGGDSIYFVGTGNSQIVSWQWYASPNFFSTTSTGWLVLTQNFPQYVELITVDANNCTAYSSMMVTPIISTIDVDAGQDTVVCSGNYTVTPQVTGGSGNYTYQWEPASYFSNPTQATQVFSNVYNQTFWVWATDANGCTSLDTINLTVIPNNTQLHDTVYLCNSTAYLELASGAFHYSWQNGQSTQGITVNQTGTYYGYGIYNGNCGSLMTIFHVLPCNPTCFNVFTYQHNPWACGDSVLFVGTAGNQVVNWTWDFGDGHIETNSYPTVYHYYPPANGTTFVVTLTTTDVNSCTTTSSNNLVIQGGAPVTVFAGNDQTYCMPGSYQLNGVSTGGTGTYTYAWSPATGLSNPNIPDPIVIVQDPICYTLTATDVNGCSDIDTLCLDYVQAINDTLYLCNGTVELCMQANSQNYIWNPGGSQGQCITVSDTGTYFGISWPGNCPTTQNFFHVFACDDNCFNDFNYQSNPWACGDSVLFNATTSAQCNQFSWDFGDGTILNTVNSSVYHYFSSGTYTVTLTTVDVNNCTSVMTQTITIADGFDVNISAYYTTNVEQFNMGSGTNITTCGGTFYDSGGPNGAYQNNENLIYTIYPATQGNVASLNFSYFNSETGYDFITIYNNTTVGGTILYGPASGSLSIGTITANLNGNPSGALTIKFTSDASVTFAGWEAAISCQAPNGQPQYPDTIFACQGNAQLNATPSVPGNYYYQWSPPTGLNNPYIANPIATMVNNVQYTVTVTDVNTGCVASDHIVVTSYNWSADSVEVCGDSITLDFGAGGQFYNWQYYTDLQGNSSGLNSYTQTLNVINPGTYFGYAIFPGCGALTSVFHVTACQTDSVWPGDANADGQAHNLDLLTIGIGYGTNGLLRPNATINWQPEASPAWGQQIQSGVDYKHIDCNGDAVIDVNDTLAVIQNYALTHNFSSIENRDNENDPMLYLVAPVDTVLTGSSVIVPVKLGSETVKASDVYGIAFTVHYNPDLLEANSMGISFNNSWFGVHGLNAISIRKNFHAQGIMDVALTRIDHQNISGYGTIGELSFITIDNLSGKQTLYETLELEITDVRLIRNNESEVQLGIQNDSIVVTDLDNAVNALSSLEASISVYPNPAQEQLTVFVNQKLEGGGWKLDVLNALGELIIPTSNFQHPSSTIDVSNFAAGVYFLRISSDEGNVSKRFTVVR